MVVPLTMKTCCRLTDSSVQTWTRGASGEGLGRGCGTIAVKNLQVGDRYKVWRFDKNPSGEKLLKKFDDHFKFSLRVSKKNILGEYY